MRCFEEFDDLIDYYRGVRGTEYERRNGLEKRCVYGVRWTERFGTITYVTDDGRIGLVWAFSCCRDGTGWVYVYPDDPTLSYFLEQAPAHIRAVLENNLRGETMGETIDWERFESKFYRLEPGTQRKLILTNWRQEERTFQESETPRTMLVFDVVRDEKEEYKPAKEWGTTSPSLAQEFRPYIEQAEQDGRNWIRVVLKRQSDKRYSVIDISDSEPLPSFKKHYPGLKEDK